MNKPKVAIIDYKMSNLFSIKNSFDVLGLDSVITSNPSIISSCDGAILPGVGAFPEAMTQLDRLDLSEAIKKFIKTGKPFMGICLGMQMLFDKSEEFFLTEGLGVIKGEVKSFKNQETVTTVPHVGWNAIHLHQENLENRFDFSNTLENENFYYFVHSFYVEPHEEKCIKTYTTHEGFEFCSSICYENIFATQFHPEKSGKMGLEIFTRVF